MKFWSNQTFDWECTYHKLLVINLPDKTTATKRIIKLPENKPTLKVVQGLWCSPSGGTRKRFMARWRSPPSRSLVTVASVSWIRLSISLDVQKCEVSTHSIRHFDPVSTDKSCKISINLQNTIESAPKSKVTTKNYNELADFSWDLGNAMGNEDISSIFCYIWVRNVERMNVREWNLYHRSSITLSCFLSILRKPV